MRQALFEYYMHSPELFKQRKAEFCEIVIGAKDEEGSRLDTYFKDPPTEEDCIARYENSTCVYQQVMDDYNVPLEMQSGFMVEGCDMDAIGVGIRAKLNSWRTLRARRNLVHEQLLSLWTSTQWGCDFAVIPYWSVLTQRFETTCTMKAVHLVERRWTLWQLDGIINEDVLNIIIDFGRRMFCYQWSLTTRLAR
jgi:hypothetical protein